MLHICNEVSLGHHIYKNILNVLKAGIQCPEKALTQFHVFLALALSSTAHSRGAAVLDIMKSIMSKAVSCEQRREVDHWYRKDDVSVGIPLETLKSLMKNFGASRGWDLVAKGVVDLSFALLDMKPALGGKPDKKLKALWQLASESLFEAVK